MGENNNIESNNGGKRATDRWVGCARGDLAKNVGILWGKKKGRSVLFCLTDLFTFN